MNSESQIAISQQLDVFGFVSGEIGRGSAVGAIYTEFPVMDEAIDGLSLALARQVLERGLPNPYPTPRDKWLQTAFALIANDQPPLPGNFAAETNVDRLIRWVDPRCERVLIGVVPELDPQDLRYMRGVAEWMNRASRLPTSIIHGLKVPVRQNRRQFKFRSALEEKLYARIELDAVLRGLFDPNVLVLTVFETRPRVDFVWTKGRLIVEIDSYQFHSSPQRFADDRQRDYETGASGYLTLRLTDHEVSNDIDLTVQKIRRYVHLRKKQFHVQ